MGQLAGTNELRLGRGTDLLEILSVAIVLHPVSSLCRSWWRGGSGGEEYLCHTTTFVQRWLCTATDMNHFAEVCKDSWHTLQVSQSPQSQIWLTLTHLERKVSAGNHPSGRKNVHFKFFPPHSPPQVLHVYTYSSRLWHPKEKLHILAVQQSDDPGQQCESNWIAEADRKARCLGHMKAESQAPTTYTNPEQPKIRKYVALAHTILSFSHLGH